MAKKIILMIILVLGALSVVSPVFANSLSSSQPDELLDAIVNGQKTVKYESGMVQPDGQILPDSAAIGISASNGKFSVEVKKPLKEGSKLLVNLGIQGGSMVNGVATKSSINLGHDVGGDYIGAGVVREGLVAKLYLDGSYRVGLEGNLLSKANIRYLLENDYVAVKAAKVGSYYNSFQQETVSVEGELKFSPKQKDLKSVEISAHVAEHFEMENHEGSKTSAAVLVGYTWGGEDSRKQLSTAASVQETDHSSSEEFQFQE